MKDVLITKEDILEAIWELCTPDFIEVDQTQTNNINVFVYIDQNYAEEKQLKTIKKLIEDTLAPREMIGSSYKYEVFRTQYLNPHEIRLIRQRFSDKAVMDYLYKIEKEIQVKNGLYRIFVFIAGLLTLINLIQFIKQFFV